MLCLRLLSLQVVWHKHSSARNELDVSLLTFKNVLTYLKISDSDEKYRCALFFGFFSNLLPGGFEEIHPVYLLRSTT